MVPRWAYLIRVHFELAYDFDGDFLAGLGIAGAIHVAEGAVAHLLNQKESLESRVSRHLAGLLSFFGDNGFDLWVTGVLLDLLLSSLRLRRGVVGLRRNIAVVTTTYRELAWIINPSLVMLLFLVAEVRFTDTMAVLLLLGVDRRDGRGGMIAGWLVPIALLGSLAMSEEILDIL